MISIPDVPRLARSGALELTARRVVEGLYAGRHRSPYLGPATEFADHRPYAPGDDLRSIDWRAYARSDHLLVRRYREERDLPLMLAIDTSASMAYGSPEKSAWAAIASAALGMLAIDQGDRVRVCAARDGAARWTAELSGSPGANALCAELSELRWSGAASAADLLAEIARRLERRSLVVLMSDLLGDPLELARQAGVLAARGHELVGLHILDRSEVELPASWGLVSLSDPESAHAPISCDAAQTKVAYDRAMAEHRERCARALAGARAEHVAVVTDQEPSEILGRWLHRRARR